MAGNPVFQEPSDSNAERPKRARKPKPSPNDSGKRRSHGDGGLYWDEERKRWTAEITVGYRPNGRRIVRKARGETKTAAKEKLKELLAEYSDGIIPGASTDWTVAEAVADWLKFGLPGRSPRTLEKCEYLARVHVVPPLGASKLKGPKNRLLTAQHVEEWLLEKAEILSTRTLREMHSVLTRSIDRAMARDRAKSNVAKLCEIPEGQDGRPSKALTLAQAVAVLEAARPSPLRAYFEVSLLTGARTEEMRELRWDHVDLVGSPDAKPPIPPHIMVWRSVRAKGETKTRKSRRTLALPERAVEVLKQHGETQNLWRGQTGRDWAEDDLVFITSAGTAYDRWNIGREFERVCKRAGLNPDEWSPRELRHSFVSLLSDEGMSSEQISMLVGHSGTSVTETVYRHQLKPVIRHGAEVMDRIFPQSETS